jgi:hypothetical protein
MLNIHLKIEAKKILNVKVCELSKINKLKASRTLIRLYDAFDNDAFKLQYKINKLSKRARRNIV